MRPNACCPSQFRAAMRLIEQPLPAAHLTWKARRWCLAAWRWLATRFVIRPHVGGGVKAAQDAAAVAAALDEHPTVEDQAARL